MSSKDQLQEDLREVRRRYDALRRGRTAPIRHCKTAADVALQGVYWHVGGDLARDKRFDLAHVVLLFPLAPQARPSSATFSFGRFLRRKLGDGDGAALRFRRLIASADREELDHRLRGVLRLACADKTPVDWGNLGADILWLLAENSTVRRRWAQDFYAPLAANTATTTGASAPTT
jgi:CRISPR type I-E-associated protein CasB/Cse2